MKNLPQILFIFVLTQLIIGCYVPSINRGYEGQRNLLLQQDIEANIWIDSSASLPYPIGIALWDSSQKVKNILINNVRVEYEDESKANYDLEWKKDLVPEELSSATDSGLKTTHVMSLYDNIPKIIDKKKNCKVLLEGYLITSNDEKLPFSTENSFKYNSEFKLYKFDEIWP